MYAAKGASIEITRVLIKDIREQDPWCEIIKSILLSLTGELLLWDVCASILMSSTHELDNKMSKKNLIYAINYATRLKIIFNIFTLQYYAFFNS